MSVSCIDSCRFTMILALAWKVAKVHFDLEASEVSEDLLLDAGISLNLVLILNFAQVSFSILHSLFMFNIHPSFPSNCGSQDFDLFTSCRVLVPKASADV
jgi:hypothetical protein